MVPGVQILTKYVFLQAAQHDRIALRSLIVDDKLIRGGVKGGCQIVVQYLKPVNFVDRLLRGIETAAKQAQHLTWPGAGEESHPVLQKALSFQASFPCI